MNAIKVPGGSTPRLARRAFSGTLPAWYVLALSLCATALTWYVAHSAAVNAAEQRFQAEIGAVRIDLDERLRAYEQVLRGGVSVFHTWPQVSREHWRSYVENLEIGEHYSGIQGIGFAQVVPAAALDAHVREVRATGFPDYRVWPEHRREVYTSIVYLEPFDWRNQRAFGYDMFQEPVRRAAMVRARDTGLTSLTGKVTLVQETDEGVQAGFLMYLPVYAVPSPADREARRRQLRGYVYSPFRMRDFMRGLLGDHARQVTLDIFDGTTTSEAALMYSAAAAAGQRPRDALTATVPVELAGTTWTLRFVALPALAVDRSKPLLIAAGALLVSILLWAIVWSLARKRMRAAAANRRLQADLAERQRAERRLRDAETSFRYLFEKNPNAMWVFDRETLLILEANDAATAQYGYSGDEFRRMRITDLRPAEDVPRLLAYTRHRPDGLRAAGQWRHLTRGGDIIDVEVVSYALEFRHRPATLVVARDVTESNRAEKALKESEAVARGVLDTALDAYVRTDQHGRVTEWNPMAERVFGWRRDEILGRRLADLLIPPDPEEVQWAARGEAPEPLFTSEGRPVLNRRLEGRARHRSGHEFPVEASFLSVTTERGEVFNGFLRDLTEKKAAEAQLRQAQKMEAVGQLSGGIAHDFNNLLTVIIGNLENAQAQMTDRPDAMTCTSQALAAAEKGGALAHRLLAFSRQQVLQPVHADLNRIIGGMLDLLQRAVGAGVEIDVRLEERLWTALADQGQVESALLNLALNARDAMPGGGRLLIESGNVTVDTREAACGAEMEPGDYVRLAVTDTGVGMEPEVAARAVEPFFTTKGIGEGSGLGLSMIYGFARQSGGHLQIHSSVGQGTTVELYLPRQVVARPAPPRPADPGVEASGTETILVVEDEAPLRELVVGTLESFGYRVLEAAQGEQAVARLRGSDPIDLLFTDVGLPGRMSGRQVADEARRLRPEIRVLFTSGHAQQLAADDASDADLQLLSKPYRRTELARRVREVLDCC